MTNKGASHSCGPGDSGQGAALAGTGDEDGTVFLILPRGRGCRRRCSGAETQPRGSPVSPISSLPQSEDASRPLESPAKMSGRSLWLVSVGLAPTLCPLWGKKSSCHGGFLPGQGAMDLGSKLEWVSPKAGAGGEQGSPQGPQPTGDVGRQGGEHPQPCPRRPGRGTRTQRRATAAQAHGRTLTSKAGQPDRGPAGCRGFRGMKAWAGEAPFSILSAGARVSVHPSTSARRPALLPWGRLCSRHVPSSWL